MVCTLAACDAAKTSSPPPSLSVMPAEATLAPLGQQAFTAVGAAAATPTVNWSVQEGAPGGSITASGLYTAPANPGSFTVVAVETGSGLSARALVTVTASTAVTHGMTIPTAHPRLWFTGDRLARARTWYAANPFAPRLDPDFGSGYMDVALRGLLANDASSCNSAISWALAKAPALNWGGGVACNPCRWYGEQIITTFDWCYNYMTPEQRSAFISATNTWIAGWRDQTTWGHPPMYQSNYFWGYLRNELEWAITSYSDNQAFAEATLDFVFTNRLQNSFNPSTLPGGGSRGGATIEGSDYGRLMSGYPPLPWQTASALGRDLFTETEYWRELVYANIHATSPGATQLAGRTGTGFNLFPYGDGTIDYILTTDRYICDWMMTVANRWPDQAVGRHAREWIALTGNQATCSRYVRSVDVPNAALAFSGLPLDFFSAGSGYLYGRNVWGPVATHFMFQGSDTDGQAQGHQHGDYGNFQIWRNGRYLTRETMTYADNIAGYANTGVIDGGTGIGHNTVLVDGANPGPRYSNRLATVERLESRPEYVFVATDLDPPAVNLVSWRRELVFVRALETFVILDRLQSSADGATKTFVNHCETNPTLGAGTATCTNGTQALVMTTLVPAASGYRVVAEGGTQGQYRIEVDTSPGTAQSHILTVLQAKDAAAPGLAPSVVDNGTSYTVVLDPSTSLTFEKGMISSGGSITTGGATTPFRSTVQAMSVTDAGPSWAP